MRLVFPHGLGREEARRRVRAREHELADFIPSMASVSTTWPSEDRMELNVSVMGKIIAGAVMIESDALAFEFDLPPALSFAEPLIKAAIEPKARKLLS